MLKAVKQSILPEAPDPPLPCFLRAHINQPLTTAATLSAAATAPLFPSIPPRTCLFVRGLFWSNLITLNLDIINGNHLILVSSRNSKRHVHYMDLPHPTVWNFLGAGRISGFMQIFLQLLKWL